MSKLDDALEARLCECLKIPGLPYSGACAKSGISERSFHEWMTRGEAEPESRYGRFRRAIEQARMEGLYNGHREVATVDVKWLLERRFPELYCLPKQKLEVTGRDGAPLAVDAGVSVIIESSTPTGSQSRKLTPFADEREGSPWCGISGLLTDSGGYVFSAEGRLLGVLRDLPAEGAPLARGLVPTSSVPSASPIDRSDEKEARIQELTQELAILKAKVASNGNAIPGRLAQITG